MQTATVIAVLLQSAVASAVTLQTSFAVASGSQFLVCYVTNAGSKPVSVEVGFVGVAGALLPGTDKCAGAPLAPGRTCQVTLPVNEDGRCIAKADGDLRANVTVFGAGLVVDGVYEARE